MGLFLAPGSVLLRMFCYGPTRFPSSTGLTSSSALV
jgi:hypothetical protein